MRDKTETYSIGKPCVHGHPSLRYKRNRHCVGCEIARSAKPENRIRQRENMRNWRTRPDSKIKKRKYHLSSRYNLSDVDYHLLLLKQGEVCASCKTPPRTKSLAVDHDHRCCPKGAKKSCGKCIRGLLCNDCNRILGIAKDNPVLLNNLIAYLREWGI